MTKPVLRRGLLNEFQVAEQKLGSRYCSYCTMMREVSTFKLRKGKPPMCGACVEFRKARSM
jgi:hypothetical protein